MHFDSNIFIKLSKYYWVDSFPHQLPITNVMGRKTEKGTLCLQSELNGGLSRGGWNMIFVFFLGYVGRFWTFIYSKLESLNRLRGISGNRHGGIIGCLRLVDCVIMWEILGSHTGSTVSRGGTRGR